MPPIKAKIHFHREQRDVQIPPRTQKAIDSQVIFDGNCPNTCPVPMGKYRLGKQTPSPSPNESAELYAFKDSIDYNSHGHEFVLSTMYIPNYFDGMEKLKSGINGQFLLPIAGGVQTLKITQEILSPIEIMSVGRQGCATRINMSFVDSTASSAQQAEKRALNAFTFNGMRFFPIMLREFTVCYYVCDKDGRQDWIKNCLDFDAMFYVAVEQPVVYDATLGLFITRHAELLPN